MESCLSNLLWWSRRKFGNAEKKMKQKTKQLELLQRFEGPENREAIKQLQSEIELMLEHEDTKWKQRAKQNWYQQGDRNTHFFHAWASHRRKINTIRRICDDEGREWQKPEDISKAFVQFYQKLFSSGGTSDIDLCLEGMEARVTDHMNARLLSRFEAAEVDFALSQMGPLKYPGLDGFAACFYQKSWPTVREEVCRSVLAFLNEGTFDK